MIVCAHEKFGCHRYWFWNGRDVGVHCIGEMGPKDLPGRILNWLSNHQIKMNSMGPIYETFFFPNHFKLTFPDNYKAFRQTLETSFPNEKGAIARYFNLVREAVKASKTQFFLKTLPEWAVLGLSATVLKQKTDLWQKTTKQVLDEITSNNRLKAVLTAQWGYYGSPPSQSSFGIHALIVRHFWNGGYYPEGGASTIAKSLLKQVTDAGGQIFLRKPVEQILIRNHKAIGVRTQAGEEYFSDRIISAVGLRATSENLLQKEEVPEPWKGDLSEVKQSPSYICLNIGFEGDILAAGATASNQWFFRAWSMEEALWDIEDPTTEAPVLYVSFPSLKDPSHNPGPQMRHTGEAVTFVPWGAFEKWKDSRRGFRSKDYLEFKKSIEKRVVQQLESLLPQLMRLRVYSELSTPLSTVHFTRAPTRCNLRP